MEKLVIVIPNYNGEQYVKDCMDSLLPEGFPILIIDNASSDHSAEYMDEYARQFPNQVRVIRMEKNTGFCGAVNKGITECNSEYVILLNNDTVIEAGFCKALLDRIESDENIFSVSSRMINMKQPMLLDDTGDLYCALGWAFAPAKDQSVKEYLKPCKIFAACAGAAIYRRAIFEQIGLFDDNHFAYLEDIDIGYRAKLYGYENWYEPSAKVYHAGSGVSGSRHNTFKVTISARNSIYLLFKNMFLVQFLLNFPLLLLGYLVKTAFFVKKGLGKAYIKGIAEGFRLSFSKKGFEHKIHWTPSRIKNACKVQLELWINTVRRFVG